MKTICILGVNLSVLKKNELDEVLQNFLCENGQHLIVTPNPEILLQKKHDEELYFVLNKASLSLPDGIGLKFAAWGIGRNLIRHTGADLVPLLLGIAQDKNIRVGIVNYDRGLSSGLEINECLKDKYPRLESRIIDIPRTSFSNSHSDIWGDFKPDIVFSTLGSPWQEKFMYHGINAWPSVKIAAGVGGAFDYLTGKARRAPKIMRLLGLEWLWRLFIQPNRWKRIINATISFPIEFIKATYIKPFFYRPNVACILYRKTGDSYEILVLERTDEAGHWQLPQGGRDGENTLVAGVREIGEELGTDKLKPIIGFNDLHKYIFKSRAGKFGVKARYASGYKGQSQSLAIVEYTGDGSDLKVNFWEHRQYKWLAPEDLTKTVHPYRQEAAAIYLKKFHELIYTKKI